MILSHGKAVENAALQTLRDIKERIKAGEAFGAVRGIPALSFDRRFKSYPLSRYRLTRGHSGAKFGERKEAYESNAITLRCIRTN